MSMTVTNVDTGSVKLWQGEFRDETFVAASAKTYLEGTLLARKAVADAIVADGTGNTGDGTCTATTVVAGSTVPLVGAYNLECITATTNGGTFKLEDPNGSLISNNLVMTAGAGASTVFEIAGMTFTLTDGATDFIVGDAFSLTVAADGKIYPYATDGAGGVQIPTAVLTEDKVATGAGNIPIRAMISGQLIAERLVIDADGDASNITAAILDQLRDFTLVALSVPDISELDNQ